MIIAAILHDTGCTKGKENHEIRGYEFAKQYIEKNKEGFYEKCGFIKLPHGETGHAMRKKIKK